MDELDKVTVELDACNELLVLAEEDPPSDDSGFPLKTVVIAFLAGTVVYGLID